MSRRAPIVPPALQAVHDTWHYAPAMRAGGLIFCSGIIGVDPASLEGEDHGALRALSDPEAQFDAAFRTLAMILEAAGADLCDVVELTSYHIDMTAHMDCFSAVRDRHFQPPWPAWTAIGVAELLVPGGLVELRAVAAAPGADSEPGAGHG